MTREISVALPGLRGGFAAAEICPESLGKTLFLQGSGFRFRGGFNGLVSLCSRPTSFLIFFVFFTHLPAKSPV
ncbi:MAG: hypothetical protein AAGF82_19705 [Pseudomonadota bacterium]